MRISDWSSDVCSSDLIDFVAPKREIVLVEPETVHQRHDVAITDFGAADIIGETIGEPGAVGEQAGPRREAIALPPCGIDRDARQIGRASCRERVCQYV